MQETTTQTTVTMTIEASDRQKDVLKAATSRVEQEERRVYVEKDGKLSRIMKDGNKWYMAQECDEDRPSMWFNITRMISR